ncbi:MAG: sel1 repeat family protein [Sphingomonadales bacterium]|nr:MAG: sel1 repeat family protein [Sphingomonadales bacterium]
MRFGGILFAITLLAATGTAAALQRSGSMPDATKQYFKRMNCHGVYDMLVEQHHSGNRLSDADDAWVTIYEGNAGTGKPCPAPPEALAKRAAERTVITAQGLDKVADYATKDDPVALYEIAFTALTGNTKDLTPQQGLGLLIKSAKLGDATAAFQLSQQYFNGLAGKQDYAGGIPWLIKAADAGHVDAQSQAGAVYANGIGTKKDLAKAFGYFKRAAEQGHVFSTYLAAQMANEGVGTKKDPALAYRLGRNLADQGEVAGAIFAASALMKMKDYKTHGDEVLYWMDLASRDGDAQIKETIGKLRPQVVSFYERATAPPPAYTPPARKVCPMKTVCLQNHYTGIQQCTTNKDYWSDCDG